MTSSLEIRRYRNEPAALGGREIIMLPRGLLPLVGWRIVPGTISVFRHFLLDGSPGNSEEEEEEPMPYSRPIRRFYLTPPSVPIFVASVILAVLAVLAAYGKMSIFNASYAFLVLLVAYLVLLVGVMFRGV
jgi:hypothetical protein